MNVFRSKKHTIYTTHLNKVSLSYLDDKRFICSNKINTYAWGHVVLKNYDPDNPLDPNSSSSLFDIEIDNFNNDIDGDISIMEFQIENLYPNESDIVNLYGASSNENTNNTSNINFNDESSNDDIFSNIDLDDVNKTLY